jgi:hypothetical protein
MHTLQRRAQATAAHRSARAQRVLRPVAGQCFEIEIDHDGGRWTIRIPEIGARTEASRRSAVEATARECIAARTGIPLGYISVWVRD